MANIETAFTFTNDNDAQLVGIIHNPTDNAAKVGLLIVVGGPQYRVGPHRQYVLMARHCAAHGIPTMRFDYQGVGDSEGSNRGFEHVTADIHHAIDEFLSRTPEIKTVALWGLCEGASAILLGGSDHKAISHIILANPWVRSESGIARTYVKHYYGQRLMDPKFWQKVFSGKFNPITSVSKLFSNIQKIFSKNSGKNSGKDSGKNSGKNSGSSPNATPLFSQRMLSGLQSFTGKIMVLKSGNDLVAHEFYDLISTHKEWKDTLRDKKVQHVDIPFTDHTFSREEWRQEVAESTLNWLLTG